MVAYTKVLVAVSNKHHYQV